MFNKIFRLFYPARHPVDLVREYHIPTNIRFSFQTKDGWIVATSEDLPGFITEAQNIRDLFEMINDGILSYFNVPRREGDSLDGQLTIDGSGSISLKEYPQTI